MRKKTVVAMQPYFFPYLGYFQLLGLADEIIILDDVQFTRKGWINRNRIADRAGNEIPLVIALESSSRETPINKMSISSTFSPKKIIDTLSHTYSKAEFYQPTMSLLQPIFDSKFESLSEWLTNSLRLTCSYLGIAEEFTFSSMIPNPDGLKGQDRILQLCKLSGASEYVNLSGGKSIYSSELFLSEDINLVFLESKLSIYQRHGKVFIPGLSIIDLMMNLEIPELQRLVSDDYELSNS